MLREANYIINGKSWKRPKDKNGIEPAEVQVL